jgi:hypothetical protein
MINLVYCFGIYQPWLINSQLSMRIIIINNSSKASATTSGCINMLYMNMTKVAQKYYRGSINTEDIMLRKWRIQKL